MTLWRRTNRYYADEEDLRGLMNALARRIDIEVNNNDESGEAYPYYMGAAILVNLMLSHDEFRSQIDLIGLFDETLKHEGIRPQIDGLGN